MSKVSVIIPNYNHARFLETRLQSVVEQTYHDIEIIYLDDASTDNSNEIFAQFTDDVRISSIFNEVNSGNPFIQWNTGVSRATGEYVWIAESDDYASPQFLEKMVPLLDSHASIGLAYCQSYEVDEHNNILSQLEWLSKDLDQERWMHDFVNTGIDECRHYLVFKNTIPNASAVLFRRSVYQSVGGAPEDFRLSGDWMCWVRILAVSDIAFLAEPLNYFRKHEKTVRNQSYRTACELEESCHVIASICSLGEVPLRNIQKTRDRILDQWFNQASWFHFSLSRYTHIYTMLSVINTQTGDVLPLRMMFLCWLKICHGFRRIRMKLKLRTRIKGIIMRKNL